MHKNCSDLFVVCGVQSWVVVLQVIKNVMWFKERAISEITLGGLLVLVVIRTIQYNMTRMRVSVVF